MALGAQALQDPPARGAVVVLGRGIVNRGLHYIRPSGAGCQPAIQRQLH
jgi:hypothetical protein